MTDSSTEVTVGVDTHKDVHVAAVLDARGAVLGCESFPTTPKGFKELTCWVARFGPLDTAGVEGTGSWGASLARHLAGEGIEVVEVNRTNRQHRRRHGKSDTADAIGAARAVQAGEATGVPKTGDGPVEAVRKLRMVLRSAIRCRTQAMNQMRSMLDTAEPGLRAELGALAGNALAAKCARLRPGDDVTEPQTATKFSLRSLGRRWIELDTEITAVRDRLDAAVKAAAPPALLAERGVGTNTAAALVVAAGDNPERMRTEASFAALCGVSPVDASSGRHERHRLNRGGDREANSALWRIVMVKMTCDQPTKDYIARRISEGKTKREAMRCVKRYLARHYWKLLTTPT